MVEDSVTFYDLGLCQEMVDACEANNWKYPTKIQQDTIPIALKGKDVCGMAETGSGKTGAYVLPMFHRLLDNISTMYGLILAPTRELCLQISEVCRQIGEGIHPRICAITGGVDEKLQIQQLKKKPHVICATPGRLAQILREDPTLNFTTIKVLVFDEADQMISDSFFTDVKLILSRIGTTRQSLLFSATMPTEIKQLADLSLNNPVQVSLSSRNEVAKSLTEYLVVSQTGKKEPTLYAILKEYAEKSVVVFVGSCKTAHIIAKMLQSLHISAVVYHGQMQQKDRHTAVDNFRKGKYSVMVATNVAARGLDVPHVDLVINYDLPEHNEEYVHRVGRAGRAERVGLSITMITMNEVIEYAKLEAFLQKKLPRKDVDSQSIEAISSDVEQARKTAVESYKEYKKKRIQKLKGK